MGEPAKIEKLFSPSWVPDVGRIWAFRKSGDIRRWDFLKV